MKNRIQRMRAGLVMVAAVLVMAACGEEAKRATSARVVVDVDSTDPVHLVVSTNFDMLLNDDGFSTSPFFRNTDSLSLTSQYDETYALSTDSPKFYAQVKNESANPEQVRMRVFLDGVEAYDVTATMANGGNLEYIYQYQSPNSGR